MKKKYSKSQLAILDAMKHLLRVKKYRDITVQDIIAQARISRSTFYTHYETKEELLEDICEGLFRHIFYKVICDEGWHNFSDVKDNQSAAIAHMLYHLRKNKDIVKNLAYSEKGQNIFSHFKKQLEKTIVSGFINSVDERDFTIPKEFLISHISSSFLNLIYWWIQQDCKQSPEEMTTYFRKIINPIFLKVVIT